MTQRIIPLKLLALATLTALLVGCTTIIGNWQHLTASNEPNICIDGIQYLPQTGGKEVAYSLQGKVKTCH